MADSITEAGLNVITEQRLNPGEMTTWLSGKQTEILFGRNPLSRYEDETPPVKVDQDILSVKLVGSTNIDTSRQQFGIARKERSPFLLTNYSSQNLTVESGKRRHILAPSMQMNVADRAQHMQGLRVSWKGGCEISVQSMGASSGDETWQVGFVWKKTQ
jgi:hypothetical protein